ncbi:MAG: hypothetical protein ACKOCX_05200 [Planctomycetota bacterium]
MSTPSVLAVALVACCTCIGGGLAAAADAAPLVLADFTSPGHGWRGSPDISAARLDGGLSVECRGEDPFLEGPPVDVPAPDARRLALTLLADCPGTEDMRLFFAVDDEAFTEERAVWLVRDGEDPRRFTAMIATVRPRMRFRIDPPAVGRVRFLRLEALPLVPLALELAPPATCQVGADGLVVEAGAVRVTHARERWNAWEVHVNGVRMADTNPREAPVVRHGAGSRELDLAAAEVTTREVAGGFEVQATFTESGADSADWRLVRRFTAGHDAVRVTTEVTTSRPRELVHLPWLTLFPGRGSFGAGATQALLPGVEYLENEPSSNERALRGPAADRRLVASWKLCLPLAAVAAADRWLAVEWDARDIAVSPWFDVPDRGLGSGANVIGLWSPAVGAGRLESEREPYAPLSVEAARPLTLTAELSGGVGTQVAAAVAPHVRRRGLPPPPDTPPLAEVARLLATGWLDSAAREGLHWRHAVWADTFPATQASDVPAYLLWLAAHVDDADLAARLTDTASAAIGELAADDPCASGISHVRRPVAPLLYGDLRKRVALATATARTLAARLADGRVRYEPGKVDYARTLGADHCNGLTAITAEQMLAEATLTGDEDAITAALAALEACDRAAPLGVPRGAQPWEMPLHTPDLVAAALLVRCQVLGYLLDGRSERIARARDWAWTGVTMTYLAPPGGFGPVGTYSTIGVLGATNWLSPVWIGQPVQWCGLVFRSALEDLARVDAVDGETWRRIARGITRVGAQMTFAQGDARRRGGLLPDYFLLDSQEGDGPAINPGTLQAHLGEAYGARPHSTVTRLAAGQLVHAVGEMDVLEDGAARTVLRLTPWTDRAARLLVTRVAAPPRVMCDGTAVAAEHVATDRVLIVPVAGSAEITIDWTAGSP